MLALGIGVAWTGVVSAQTSRLIAEPNATSVSFDRLRDQILVATSTGLLRKYDLNSLVEQPSVNVGGSLTAIDVSYDSTFALVGQGQPTVSETQVVRVPLDGGATTTYRYPQQFFFDGQVQSLALGVAKAFVSTGRDSSTRLLEIDLATGVFQPMPPVVPGSFQERVRDQLIFRASDRSRMLFLTRGNTSGNMFSYTPGTNTYGPLAASGTFQDFGAVNPDGSLATYRIPVNGATTAPIASLPDLTTTRTIAGDTRGLAFDESRSIVYATDPSNSTIRVANAVTGVVLPSIAIGETLDIGEGRIGRLYASPDGKYLAVITNSGVRVLTIPTNGLSAQVKNVSTRSVTRLGSGITIAGFVIRGGSKRVLIRAIGKSLENFGVSDVLQNPTLTLTDAGGATLQSNDDWRSSQQADIQASGLAPSNDQESAILVTLTDGSYTAQVRGLDGTQGVSLVEVYDLEPGVGGTIVNLSTRTNVESESGVAIGGFVVNGNKPRRLLVRALGPTLGGFGVANFLPEPVLTIFDAKRQQLAYNRGWKSVQRAAIEATPFVPGDDRESAILLTLPPGAYTAVVSSAEASVVGVAIVEVYDLE